MSQTALQKFPEELLQAVVEYVASDTVFIERQMLVFLGKHARATLLSLSVTNRQFRRLCFRFLFAYVKVRHEADLKSLLRQCIFSKSFTLAIRTLDFELDRSESYFEEFNEAFCELLDRSSKVSKIILKGFPLDIPLLNAINRHPVSSVLLSSMSESFQYLISDVDPKDLVKIMVHDTEVSEPNWIADCVECDLKMRNIILRGKPELLESWNFQGLCELTLNLDNSPLLLSWLPDFTCAHPLLKKIKFSHFDPYPDFELAPAVPFVQPFLDAIHRQELDADLNIQGFAVARILPNSNSESALGPLGEWYITGLHISLLNSSPGEILCLAHSCFPKITILTIRTGFASFDEVVDPLSLFSSLQVVTFIRPFKLLGFGAHIPDAAETEAAMIQYTSRIAQRIPTIEAFYISGLRDIRGRARSLGGWLNVQTLPGIEGRHTVGPLCYGPSNIHQTTSPERFPPYHDLSFNI